MQNVVHTINVILNCVDSLKSRLSEHQETCCTNTARCVMDCVHALQEWNHSPPARSTAAVQVLLLKLLLFVLCFKHLRAARLDD